MPNIHQAVFIAAPAEKIYGAITSEEGLSAWWTPHTKATAKVGSTAHFPFGPRYFKEMKITELKPSGLVRWTCTAGAGEWVGTNLSFSLEAGDKGTFLLTHPEITGQLEQQDSDSGTLLVFHHDNWKDYTLMFAECSYTWGQFLRSLKLYCETGQGRPWPEQHRD